MNRAMLGFIAVVVTAVCSVATQAAAPSQNTYVSYRGVDTNPCTRVLPCRTVTQALTTTNSGGTVHIIDTGEYAGFSINTDATIVADPGVAAAMQSITVTEGNITLKNLQVVGMNQGIILTGGNTILDDVSFFYNAIDIYNEGASLSVRRCHFNGTSTGYKAILYISGYASVRDSEFNNYPTAIYNIAGDMLVSHCTFTNNQLAIYGPFMSSGDNVFYNNTHDVTQAPTPATIY